MKTIPQITTTRRYDLSRKFADCPICGTFSRRHSLGCRLLNEIGIAGPVMLEVKYSKHRCKICRKHFSVSMEHIAPPYGHYTHRVRSAAIELVAAQGLTFAQASVQMWERHFVEVPVTTVFEWVTLADYAAVVGQ